MQYIAIIPSSVIGLEIFNTALHYYALEEREILFFTGKL
jgi:hypothetical protein